MTTGWWGMSLFRRFLMISVCREEGEGRRRGRHPAAPLHLEGVHSVPTGGDAPSGPADENTSPNRFLNRHYCPRVTWFVSTAWRDTRRRATQGFVRGHSAAERRTRRSARRVGCLASLLPPLPCCCSCPFPSTASLCGNRRASESPTRRSGQNFNRSPPAARLWLSALCLLLFQGSISVGDVIKLNQDKPSRAGSATHCGFQVAPSRLTCSPSSMGLWEAVQRAAPAPQAFFVPFFLPFPLLSESTSSC